MGRPIALLALLLAGCGPGDRPRHLILAAPPPLAPLARELAERFRREHPGVRVDVTDAASAEALAEARKGLADVALVGRELRPGEADLRGTVIARDGVALVVHPDNLVPPPDERQLVGLLTGTYTDWRQLGGTPVPVRLFGPADGADLREALLSRLGIDPRALRPVAALPAGGEVAAAVAREPGGLGFLSLADARRAGKERKLPSVRVLAAGGAEATAANVASGLYPFARSLVVVARPSDEGPAKEFVEFAASGAARGAIEAHGFAPLLP